MTLSWVAFRCTRCGYALRLRVHIERTDRGGWRPADWTWSGRALLRLAAAHMDPRARRVMTIERAGQSSR